MRKTLLAFLLLSAAAHAQTTHPAGVTGCIARWDFANNGTVSYLADVSNNNHNAAAFNLTSANGFRNHLLQAAHFNGINSSARVPTALDLNPQQISIVAMVKFTGFYAGQCQANNIIYKSVSYFMPGCWAMLVDDQNYDQNCSTYSPNFEQMNFAGSSVGGAALPSGNYLTQNDWYLLVTTYDGNRLDRYQILMDTATKASVITPVSSSQLGITLGANNEDVTIGATQNASYPYYLNADVDEISLFNKALTSAEVKSIYDYIWGSGLSVAGNQLLNGVTTRVARGALQVNNPKAGTTLNVAIYDMAGRQLISRATHEAAAAIDLSGYAAGMLMVRLEREGAVITRKICNQ